MSSLIKKSKLLSNKELDSVVGGNHDPGHEVGLTFNEPCANNTNPPVCLPEPQNTLHGQNCETGGELTQAC